MKKYFLLTAGMLLLYPLLFGQTVPSTDSPFVAVRLTDEPRWYLSLHSAKQRKELLTEALRTLNDLANSADEDVQRKARERIATLRNIASTVHD